eukprot:GILI01002893.1.p1 GENE.GILI01002893.1~~GILI01002893.1.p1  ORF type:complete len:747 (+),score=200.05 GILI01002893.1:79-2319(+)
MAGRSGRITPSGRLTPSTMSALEINVARPHQNHGWFISDIYNNFDDVELMPSFNMEEVDAIPTYWDKMKALWDSIQPHQWIYLSVLGLVAGIVTIGVDYIEKFLHSLRHKSADTGVEFLDFIMWIVSSVVLVCISTFVCYKVSKAAEGSGIPELKSILSGVVMPKYLTFKTFIAKVFGLVFGLSSGLSIGKEGPFVHIGGILASQLCKVPGFRKIEKSMTSYRQMLAAGVAAGVAAAFGTPFGAVLFSIETTASYYIVSHMWKAFFCSVWCGLAYKILHEYSTTEHFFPTDFQPVPLGWEFLCYALLGVFCGLLGAGFVYFLSKVIFLKKSLPLEFLKNRYQYCAIVAIITATTTFWLPYWKSMDQTVINEMFSSKTFAERGLGKWTDGAGGLYLHLSIYVVTKLVFSCLGISCPIPSGTFIPIFTLGAVFGRLYGEVWTLIAPVGAPGGYAVAGACGLIAGATHTLSVGVIAFELTGQLNHMLPVLIVVLIAYSVGSSLSLALYDMLLDMKGIPSLPTLKDRRLYRRHAGDIMIGLQKHHTLTRDATQTEAEGVLNQCSFSYIAVVEDRTNNYLIGAISRARLQLYLELRRKNFQHGQNPNELEPEFFEDNHPLPIIGNLFSSSSKSKNHAKYQNISKAASSIDNMADDPDMPEIVEEEKNDVLTSLPNQTTVYTEAEMNSLPVDLNHPYLNLDPAPFQITDQTPMSKIHYLFTMLGLAQMFIVRRGKLVGVLPKEELIRTFVDN